jgi:hypothetical protein
MCCHECDNEMALGCIYVVTKFAAGAPFLSYSGLSKADTHSLGERQASALGTRAMPRRGVTPTKNTLTDILWCNNHSLYKGECRRKAEALVVQ